MARFAIAQRGSGRVRPDDSRRAQRGATEFAAIAAGESMIPDHDDNEDVATQGNPHATSDGNEICSISMLKTYGCDLFSDS